MAPVNRIKILALACAAITVVGVVAGIKIQQSIQSPAVRMSPVVVMVDGTSKSSPQASPVFSPVSGFVSTAQPSKISVAPIVMPQDQITAQAYMVGNILTGHIYLSSHPSDVMPVASMSKLVTAITATDSISGTTTIAITPAEADVPADGSGIGAGESFSLSELLYPLLLDSSNVAAEAIASSSDRQKFMSLMSSYAWEIGMPTSHFADPSGLSPDNKASAKDIFALASYLYVYRPDILALTRIVHMDIATTSDHGSHSIDSIHPFVDDTRFIGGKTGRTPAAGETMMTILRIDSQPIVFIVMGSDYGRRQSDTNLLIQKYEDIKK
jgi:D-alanyl-D-alanine endopeptidase (penicillin-binding protein 7)